MHQASFFDEEFERDRRIKNGARGAVHHERTEEDKSRDADANQSVLAFLHSNKIATTQDLIEVGGHRFSTRIQSLRERGYVIKAERGEKRSFNYRLTGFEKCEPVTQDLKDTYYASSWWRDKAYERKRFDGFKCVKCKSTSGLHTHHWVYHLFEEELFQLTTFCSDCHLQIHDWCEIKWPNSIPESVAKRIREGASRCS